GLLVGIGTGFPLLVHLAGTLLKVLEQFQSFPGIDGRTDTVIEIGFAQQKRDAVPLEIYLCKAGFVVT
ncbi:MAG TPA: hypothetical protein VFG48_06620, partial [Xanthomonadales bacterium]|nr:hypothetical protein [Xanthomonadales bacterium]